MLDSPVLHFHRKISVFLTQILLISDFSEYPIEFLIYIQNKLKQYSAIC